MEWKEYKFSNIGKIVTGKTPRTAISDNYGGKIPFLSPSDDMQTKYVPITARCLTEKGLSEVKNCLIPSNSICVSCIGSDMGKSVITKEPIVTNQQINSIIPSNEFDSNFIYYVMQSKRKEIRFMGGNGTAVPILNKTAFSNLTFFAPSLFDQRRIASILSSLDDKIAINRRICENLEAQAQALFKHWFIDFAPFKNGKFVESELGMIPEGWRVGRLGELGEVVGGATPSKANDSYYTQKGIAWLTPKDLSNKLMKFTSRGEIDITQEGYDSCSAKLMPKGSVLFSSRAPIGYLTIAKNEICTNQGFKSVVPKYAGTAYIYYLLKNNTKRIESMASGTTFKEASGSLMKSLSVVVPPKRIIDEYEASVAEMFNEQEVIEQESSRLSALRDTLLPKLMSREIKV
ncbi:MAG: restriction endonuclease subunit S [Prevotella sp.]|nr:restriction endonuclease subunit S [Prevotella sp.]